MSCSTGMSLYSPAYAAAAARRLGAATLPPRTGPVPPAPPAGMPPGCETPPYYPPSCSPCPPSDEAVAAEMAAYQIACQTEAAQIRRAVKAQVLGNAPQIPLGAGTPNGNPAGPVVTAGGIATFTAVPSVPMCITRIIVPSIEASFFLVTSIKVARTELLGDGFGITAELFRPDATNTTLFEFPELWPGTPITITVQNIDAADHPFHVTYLGVQTGQPGPCLG